MPILHRKGRKYLDTGNELIHKPEEGTARVFRLKQDTRERLEFLRYTNPVAFSDLASRVTVELVRFLVDRNEGAPVELMKVMQEGAHKIGVSMETVKRYVITHSAEGAELVLVGKRVSVNEDWLPEDEDE